ncbi:MAG: hypothetical protein IJL47_07135 [Lachnospiraceae bacterium]|nr:hypothetical protein [Lachnospiraceae bacterium]
MKLLQLIRIALSRDLSRRILLSVELIIGLVFLLLCVSLMMKNREIDRYMEMYSDLATIDPNNAEQLAYTKEHGIIFAPTVQLQPEQRIGKKWFAEINSLDFYCAVPLKLSDGSWFLNENHGCTYNAIVPYSLRKQFATGRCYEISFIECGTVSIYVCGILDSDITFGNSYAAGFDDSNCHMLLCLAKGEESHTDFTSFTHYYVKLKDVELEALQALNIDAVCLMKDAFHQGNYQVVAVPVFLSLILLVLFGTALLGDRFLSAKENEKTFAIYFLCGASTREAVLLQSSVNFVEILIPFLLSLVVALVIPIRLYALSVLGILLVLIVGSGLLSLAQMVRLRRKSPSQIIARRFRG